MRRVLRSSFAVGLTLVLLAATTASVAAADSRITFTLTLKGHVPAGIGFDLGVAPGVGGSNPFCVAANDHTLDDVGVPTCRGGGTYTTVVTLAEGESIEYSVTLYHPTSARILWSGRLTGDGQNHRRDYVVDFDLPATDVAPAALTAPAGPVWPPRALPAPLVLAWLVGWGAWLDAVRRRRRTVRA